MNNDLRSIDLPGPTLPPQLPASQEGQIPMEVQAISTIINPLAKALERNAECQLEVEKEKNSTERLKLSVASRTNNGVFVICGALLVMAFVALFMNKDAIVLQLASLVVGILAGFGIGYGVKSR